MLLWFKVTVSTGKYNFFSTKDIYTFLEYSHRVRN